MRVGVGTHSTGDATMLRSLGTITRITHYPSQDLRETAARVQALRAVGLEVVVVQHAFSGSPFADTASAIAALAAACPDALIQVLNEPETLISGYVYADLMRRVVVAAPRGTRLLGAGLGTVDNRFTAQYLAHDGPTLHAWSLHVYGLPLAESLRVRVGAVRQQLGDRMPLWVTEIGVDADAVRSAWPTVPQTPAHIDEIQAKEMQHALHVAAILEVPVVIAYQLQSGGDTGFSFLRNDGSERPVAQRLREWK